jgi:hypothetical protein
MKCHVCPHQRLKRETGRDTSGNRSISHASSRMIKYSSVLDESLGRKQKGQIDFEQSSVRVTISISIDFSTDNRFLLWTSRTRFLPLPASLLLLSEREKLWIHLACLLMIQDKYYDDRPLPLSWSRTGVVMMIDECGSHIHRRTSCLFWSWNTISRSFTQHLL